MSNITREVNKVYSKRNLQLIFVMIKFILHLLKPKEFLLKLKLPRLFSNSSLIDFGCGMGQNNL